MGSSNTLRAEFENLRGENQRLLDLLKERDEAFEHLKQDLKESQKRCEELKSYTEELELTLAKNMEAEATKDEEIQKMKVQEECQEQKILELELKVTILQSHVTIQDRELQRKKAQFDDLMEVANGVGQASESPNALNLSPSAQKALKRKKVRFQDVDGGTMENNDAEPEIAAKAPRTVQKFVNSAFFEHLNSNVSTGKTFRFRQGGVGEVEGEFFECYTLHGPSRELTFAQFAESSVDKALGLKCLCSTSDDDWQRLSELRLKKHSEDCPLCTPSEEENWKDCVIASCRTKCLLCLSEGLMDVGNPSRQFAWHLLLSGCVKAYDGARGWSEVKSDEVVEVFTDGKHA